METDAFGGFRLLMQLDMVLDVLPATSYRREHWRVFRPGKPETHFVLFEQDDRATS